MVSLGNEEQWVARCVQAALPGVTVGQHDDNTKPSMYDLDLSVGGMCTFGAMEVTTDIDCKQIKFWKYLERYGGRLTIPEIAGGWQISVRPDTQLNRLIPKLSLLLQDLEQVDSTTISTSAAWDELMVLGVVWANQGGTDFRGSIYLMPEIPFDRLGGVVALTGDALSKWVSEWIIEPSRSDNLSKLRRSAARERHLFIIVPVPVSTAPFSVTDLLMRTDAPLPTVDPVLPSDVTHVWVMGDRANKHGFRWSPEHGWERFANDPVLAPTAIMGCTCRQVNDQACRITVDN